MTVVALPHIAAGRKAGVTGICARIVVVACVAFPFRALVTAQFVHRPWELAFAIMALLVFFGWLVDTLVTALIRADDVGARFTVALRDPTPGGATVLVSAADQDRIAELGADVIREAGVLDDVAELVRCQSWPARGHDPAPPVGSMIIRAANAFDDMVGGSTDRDRSAAAIEQMRHKPPDYDPRVVAVLARVAGAP